MCLLPPSLDSLGYCLCGRYAPRWTRALGSCAVASRAASRPGRVLGASARHMLQSNKEELHTTTTLFVPHLDHHEYFLSILNFALPLVNARDLWQDVHARHQPLRDQCRCDLLRLFHRRRRYEHGGKCRERCCRLHAHNLFGKSCALYMVLAP